MILNLTELSSEPLHSQIYTQLFEKMIAGDIEEGSKLESMRAFASKERVGVRTIERAYRSLETVGLIKYESADHFEGDRAAIGNAIGIEISTVEAERRYYVVPLSENERQEIVRQRRFENFTPLNVIEKFSNELSSIYDTNKLRDILNKTLETHLMVSSTNFAFRHDNLRKYRLLKSNTGTEEFLIETDDPLLLKLRQLKMPTYLSEIRDETSKSVLRKELESRGAKLVFPFIHENELFGFIALSSKSSGEQYTLEEINLLIVMSNQFVAALKTTQYHSEMLEKRCIEKDLNSARQIQANLLPKGLPDDELVSVAAYSKSSQKVGGDFYDCIMIDEYRFALVIGDACGKGVPAAMLISQIQGLVKSAITSGKRRSEIMESLNRHLKEHTTSDNFATLFYGIYDIRTGVFKYSNGGHNYPIIVRKNGETEFLNSTGPALGISLDAKHSNEKITLKKGDSLLMYTDGVTETMKLTGEQYGEQRLLDVFASSRNLKANQTIDKILTDLRIFHEVEPLQDDRTLLILKKNN